jgi:hypothetical protein
MEKETERSFLQALWRGLISLPFDVKVLLEAAADPNLEHDVRESAAGTVVHIIAPRDGNVESYLRYAEDVILLRLTLRRILVDGGEGAAGFRDRFGEQVSCLEEDLGVMEKACGPEIIDWLKNKDAALRKTVYSKKKVTAMVDNEDAEAFLYDEGLRFGTEYSISEKTLHDKLKQGQPVIDHLIRKCHQDKKKLTYG